MESQLRPLVGKGRQIQDAKDMQNIVQERTARKGQDPPPYEFLELIGRGSYGRVYKSKHRVTQEICAVKIIEVDAQDYKADIESRDDTIKEFIRETTILQSLKDNRARNVNVIFEAFSVDSQLWIVSEYCPGGSVSTLMKASTPPGLEEQFIIPIAREVAIALKYVHEAGIIHRDIKCANILATEDGRIQLCDFGISGVLENEVSKRSTIVGTPHWMAPELVTHLGSDIHSVRYGTEIDCWAFGCAVYEMATGHPPNSRVRPGDLGMTLHVRAPRLEDDKYSQALRDFVAFCLEQDPDDRPSAQEIMKHAYIANTEEEYPTEGIRKLIVNYAIWEQSGGQRASLFNPYGAPAPDQLSPLDGPEEEWNFSTSVEFDRRISMRLSMAPGGSARDLSNFEKIIEEGRVKRGGAAMDRLFNPNDKRGYTYGDRDSQMSDLPLRNFSDAPAGDRTTMIDLDAAMPMVGDVPSLDFPDVTTIKARKYLRDFDDDDDEMYAQDQQTRRATMDWKPPEPVADNPNRLTRDWKFPSMIPDDDDDAFDSYANEQTARRLTSTSLEKRNDQAQKRETQAWTFPTPEEMRAAVAASRASSSYSITDSSPPSKPTIKHAKTLPPSFFPTLSSPPSPDRGSMIDLDRALQVDIPPLIYRPSTAASATDSAITDMTSGDPFDLEPALSDSPGPRSSLHVKSRSEPTAAVSSDSKPSEADRSYDSDDPADPHNRSSSLYQVPPPRDRSNSARGRSARYRTRRPTALQHAPWPSGSGSVDDIGSSADDEGDLRSEGSFGAGYAGGAYAFAWDDGDGDAAHEGWEESLQRRGRGQPAFDEAATLRPGMAGSFGGSARVMVGDTMVPMPYEPRREAMLPGAGEGLMRGEMKRLAEDLEMQLRLAERLFGEAFEVALEGEGVPVEGGEGDVGVQVRVDGNGGFG